MVLALVRVDAFSVAPYALESKIAEMAKKHQVSSWKITTMSIVIVFIWIGLLKFVPYEADSIPPFVANSPVMSFFYEHPEEYKQHMTHEGELKPQEREWQKANNTYRFSNGLGVVEIIIALLVLAGALMIMADSARSILYSCQ